MGKRSLIFYNPNSKKGKTLLDKIKKLLNEKGISFKIISVLENLNSKIPVNADFAICLGGDGTVLYASHVISDKDIPLMSINSGGLGFLSSVEMDEAESFLSDYLNGNYRILNRTLLDVSYRNKKYIALNDCVLKSMDIRSFYIDVYYNEEFLSSYFADGIIVSTPTGSTAYALSSGGPIIHIHSKVVSIVPISPHTLTHRPVVLPENAVIKLYPYSKDKIHKFNAKLSVDGQINLNIKEKECVTLKISDRCIKMIVSKKYLYFDVLRKKLSWGERSDRKTDH